MKILLVICIGISTVDSQSDNVNINELDSVAASPIGQPYLPWTLVCDRRRSIQGVKARAVRTERGNDVFIQAFCQTVAAKDDPLLVSCNLMEETCKAFVL